MAATEDILDVYQRPHDPECAMVCEDETSKQLIAETRVPNRGEAEAGRSIRLQMAVQRHGQPVHDVCLGPQIDGLDVSGDESRI